MYNLSWMNFRVGKLIVTKCAGKWAPENITEKYKFPEGKTSKYYFICFDQKLN